MHKDTNTMKTGELANLLFFTQSAIEKDDGLANTRLDALPGQTALGQISFQGKPHALRSFTLSSLLALWRAPALEECRCRRCGSRRLFLYGFGGFGLHFHSSATLHCPFCHETRQERDYDRWISRQGFLSLFRFAKGLAEKDAALPDGLPGDEVCARLLALRDADLLDPAHPIEEESLAAAGVKAPVLSGHGAWSVEAARARAQFMTPEFHIHFLAQRADIVVERRRIADDMEKELATLNKCPTIRMRFKKGLLSEEEYSALRKRKYELTAALAPERQGLDFDRAIVVEAEKTLGRALSQDERTALLEVFGSL